MKRLTIRGTALALVVFLDVTYVLCVLWGLALPCLHARSTGVFEAVFPGFTWLTPQSFVLGLAWTTLFGLYTAALFVPLFNYFEGRRSAGTHGVRSTPGEPVSRSWQEAGR
jgi:hypothetical protein